MSNNQDRYAVLTDDEIKVIAKELENFDLGLDCSPKRKVVSLKDLAAKGIKKIKGWVECQKI